MYCSKCGSEINETTKFCGKCGNGVGIHKFQTDVLKQENPVKDVENNSDKSDDDKKWSEKSIDEKIETVYDIIVWGIVAILVIKYHSEIGLMWEFAESKFFFVIDAIVLLCTIGIWYIPLFLIKAVCFVIKKKERKLLYALLSIPGCIIYSVIASETLGKGWLGILFLIAAVVVGNLLFWFKKTFINKDDLTNA